MLSRYVCEELEQALTARLQQQLRQLGCSSALEDVFWLPVPNSLLSPLQKEHMEQCGPYGLALVVEESSFSLEFLVRASNALHCNCTAPASSELRAYALNELDAMLASAMER